VAHTVEEDTVSLDVIADTVVAHPHTPLAYGHVRQPATLIGVGLELAEDRKHPPMRLGIKAAEIPPEAI
jgi:hypothetical protein